MSDNVNITGAQFNSTNLPKWATEETAERIATLLEASLPKGKAKKAAKMLAAKKVKELEKEMGTLRKGTRGLSQETTKTTKAVRDLGGAVATAAGAVLGSLVGIVKDNVAAYRELYETGINLGGGLFDTAKMVHQAGLNMEEFSNATKSYTTAVNRFGVKGIATAVGNMEQQFASFGMTTQQGTEYLAGYLERQRLSGFTDRQMNKQREEAALESINRFTELSKALGVSRKQIEESSTEMLGSAQVQSRLLVMEEQYGKERAQQAAKNVEVVSSMFAALGKDGEQFGKVFMDAFARGTPMASEAFQQMFAQAPEVGAQVGQLLEETMLGELTPEEAKQNMLKIQDLLRANADRLGAMATAGDDGAVALMSALRGFNEFAINLNRMDDQMDPAAEGMAKLENTMRRLSNLGYTLANAILGNEDVQNGLNKIIEFVNVHLQDIVQWAVSGINAITKFLETAPKEGGIGGWLTEKLLNGFGGLVGGLVALTMAPAFIGSLAGLLMGGMTKIIKSLLFKGIPKLIPSMTKPLSGMFKGGFTKIAGSFLGTLGAVAGAGLAGWEIGSWIQDKWEKEDPESYATFGNFLGQSVDTLLAAFGSDDARSRLDSMQEMDRIRYEERKAREAAGSPVTNKSGSNSTVKVPEVRSEEETQEPKYTPDGPFDFSGGLDSHAINTTQGLDKFAEVAEQMVLYQKEGNKHLKGLRDAIENLRGIH